MNEGHFSRLSATVGPAILSYTPRGNPHSMGIDDIIGEIEVCLKSAGGRMKKFIDVIENIDTEAEDFDPESNKKLTDPKIDFAPYIWYIYQYAVIIYPEAEKESGQNRQRTVDQSGIGDVIKVMGEFAYDFLWYHDYFTKGKPKKFTEYQEGVNVLHYMRYLSEDRKDAHRHLNNLDNVYDALQGFKKDWDRARDQYEARVQYEEDLARTADVEFVLSEVYKHGKKLAPLVKVNPIADGSVGDAYMFEFVTAKDGMYQALARMHRIATAYKDVVGDVVHEFNSAGYTLTSERMYGIYEKMAEHMKVALNRMNDYLDLLRTMKPPPASESRKNNPDEDETGDYDAYVREQLINVISPTMDRMNSAVQELIDDAKEGTYLRESYDEVIKECESCVAKLMKLENTFSNNYYSDVARG